MKKDTTKLNKGFTLVESLVAIAILLVAVVGPMSVIGGSLSQISTARDQAIAINLAQEGIEIARQRRDSNMLNAWGGGGAVWSDGLAAGTYIVSSVIGTPLMLCSVGCTMGQKPVRQDAAGWYYQGAGGTPTKFIRTVTISDSSPGEKRISSDVTWEVGGTTKTVQVQELILGINS